MYCIIKSSCNNESSNGKKCSKQIKSQQHLHSTAISPRAVAATVVKTFEKKVHGHWAAFLKVKNYFPQVSDLIDHRETSAELRVVPYVIYHFEVSAREERGLGRVDYNRAPVITFQV